MLYAIRFSPRAERQFLDLPPDVMGRIDAAILALASNPRPQPPLGKKLEGYRNRYRLAVGPYRVVYEVRQREGLVLVIWVGRRRDAYRE